MRIESGPIPRSRPAEVSAAGAATITEAKRSVYFLLVAALGAAALKPDFSLITFAMTAGVVFAGS